LGGALFRLAAGEAGVLSASAACAEQRLRQTQDRRRGLGRPGCGYLRLREIERRRPAACFLDGFGAGFLRNARIAKALASSRRSSSSSARTSSRSFGPRYSKCGSPHLAQRTRISPGLNPTQNLGFDAKTCRMTSPALLPRHLSRCSPGRRWSIRRNTQPVFQWKEMASVCFSTSALSGGEGGIARASARAGRARRRAPGGLGRNRA